MDKKITPEQLTIIRSEYRKTKKFIKEMDRKIAEYYYLLTTNNK